MKKNLYNNKKIKVNFETYKVSYGSEEQLKKQFSKLSGNKTTDTYLGYCDYINKEIWIMKDMMATQQWRVLNHELGHAVDHEYSTLRSIECFSEMLAEYASVLANVIDHNDIRRKL